MRTQGGVYSFHSFSPFLAERPILASSYPCAGLRSESFTDLLQNGAGEGGYDGLWTTRRVRARVVSLFQLNATKMAHTFIGAAGVAS